MRNGHSAEHAWLLKETAEVEAALRLAVRKALLDHKRTGDPIVVFRDGEVRWIPADEIRVPSARAR